MWACKTAFLGLNPRSNKQDKKIGQLSLWKVAIAVDDNLLSIAVPTNSNLKMHKSSCGCARRPFVPGP